MNQHDPPETLLWNLRTLHDSAIRGYYTFELLRRLVRSQEKTLLEQIQTPADIVAAVVGIWAFIAYPSSAYIVVAAVTILIVILASLPFIKRRFWKSDDLDDLVYLGIYLDQVAKYVNEIKLAQAYASSKAVIDFIDDAKDALRGNLPYLRKKLEKFNRVGEYPACLEKLGRSENWMGRLQRDITQITGEAL
jgi:hypothetical protein